MITDLLNLLGLWAVPIWLGLFFFILYALLDGKTEQLLFDDPPDGGDFKAPGPELGKFSLPYHGTMALRYLLIGAALQQPLFIPSALALEDAAYFFFSKQDSITEKSWITGSLGGFRIGGQYIPFIYLILHGATVLLYCIKYFL
jgi:hypothetical protein